jgi:carbon storage regulator
MIGETKITVVEIRGDKVRLGIIAEKEIPVHRLEVYEAIHGRSSSKEPTPEEIEAGRELKF